VTIGLVVIVAALLPLVLNGFGLDEQALWRVASLVFLALSWSVIFLAARTRDNRDVIRDEARQHPRASAFFWLALELPVQVPLILAVLAIPPDLGEAYYTTALVFNLFQAAFVMAQFVYAKVRAGS
jgi:hypothetical protein